MRSLENFQRCETIKRLCQDLDAWPSADTLERVSAEAAVGSGKCTILAPAFEKVRCAASALLAEGSKPDPLLGELSDALNHLDTLVCYASREIDCA